MNERDGYDDTCRPRGAYSTEDGVAHMIVSECGQIGIRSDRRQRLPKQIQLRFHARHQCCLNKLVEVICRDG